MFGDRTPYPIPGAPPDFLSGETHPASDLLLLPRADPSARSLTRRVSTPSPLDPSLLCSASSPIAATVITFWALLITSMCKLEAASSADGIEWRMSHVDGELCFGECDSVRYNAFTDDARKFDKPTGMDEGCEWFPTTRTLPNSNLDYAAGRVVLSNLCSQLGSGLFLIFCGSLGDFGTMRHRGLKAGLARLHLRPHPHRRSGVPLRTILDQCHPLRSDLNRAPHRPADVRRLTFPSSPSPIREASRLPRAGGIRGRRLRA